MSVSFDRARALMAEALQILSDINGAHHVAAHLDLALCRLDEFMEAAQVHPRKLAKPDEESLH